ncbi:MAG: metal-dependent hydrolase [Hydrogenophaga sp.]|uniref:metal-dependent hydrolase n=1 Tax=Hydrogenophaga sp. TaxID=1904254 RepID=UPI001BC126EA|nr:metal-dependent hydrolase [Hydrogenophaga sp.]MBS3910997.1 metal-dependent hydrolase [Hydrogenophaga sp.]MDO9602951.1 metal-dependent hydrolase [Hydrogenophaga sp.]MDP2166352.1 metal-dependent hydrolase [Hydrogenophaga sp.]MDP3475766.1 metal-dependent hydrolase [Hydrogenophaga sp.]
MDSLTQIALGSAVSVAVMGRRTAVWKAALWGAVAGTLPDLDAFIDHGNAVLNMVRHRAESHSLFFLTLGAPVLAWVVSRLHGETALFRRWWLALWLVLFTHPLLDTMTVYGTQLLQPFTDHPFGVGSIFIIDPLYTVPLIVGVVAALRLQKSARGLPWNLAGLTLSTLYLGWSFGAQQHATQVARASLAVQGIETQGLLVTPAPFNTVLWRLVATTPTQYFEGYYSLLDNGQRITWTAHDRGAALIEQHRHEPSVARMAAFTHGFYSLAETDGRLFVTDLRMGQEPAYTFRFDLGSAPARVSGQHLPVQQSRRPDLGTALPWLWQRMWGNDVALPRL